MNAMSLIDRADLLWAGHAGTITLFALAANFGGWHVAYLPLTGVMLADASMLGVLAAVCSRHPRRFATLLLAFAAVAALMVVSGLPWDDLVTLAAMISMLACLAVGGFAAVSLLIQSYHIRAIRVDSPNASNDYNQQRIQFSLRQLLTAAVVLTAVASAGSWIQFWPDGWTATAVLVSLLAPLVVLSQLAAGWALLMNANPVPCLLVIAPATALLSLAAAVSARRHLWLDLLDYRDYPAFVAESFVGINMVQAGVSAITFFILRRRGWRLFVLSP